MGKALRKIQKYPEVTTSPGPWEVLDYTEMGKGYLAIVTEGGKHHIADVFPFGARLGFNKASLEEHRANAALIKAAPDLLAECEKIAGWLEKLAARADEGAKDTRFASLAEAYAADAKNYRATAASVRATIAKAHAA